MSTIVALSKCRIYDRSEIAFATKKLLSLLGGIDKWIKPGYKVLIKPNILSNVAPQSQIVTHPEIVRAIALNVKETGATVWIGDSPGIGTLKMVSIESGIKAVAEELNVELKEFGERVPLKSHSGYSIDIAKAVIDADIIVNLPKVKTHTQMLMTLGVKNCFGCIPGTDKAQWHLRAGISEDCFARMLVDTYLLVKPALTIADGVVGMDGNGPSCGNSKPLGWLAASEDAVAMDRIIMELLQLDPSRLKTLEQAKKAGAGETELKNIRIVGDTVASLKVSGFKIPDRLQSLQFERLPAFLRKYFREFLTSRPILIKSACIRCGRCFEACPAGAIQWKAGRLPRFFYHRCIRCFCCQEMCQSKAIATQDGYGLKILQPFRKMLLRRLGI